MWVCRLTTPTHNKKNNKIREGGLARAGALLSINKRLKPTSTNESEYKSELKGINLLLCFYYLSS